MEFKEIIRIAQDVRQTYEAYETQNIGRPWNAAEIAQGFVGDVGDLMKLVMAKEGIRTIEGVDEKLAHELSDCLWSILVLADKYGVDLENVFPANMGLLKEQIEARLQK